MAKRRAQRKTRKNPTAAAKSKQEPTDKQPVDNLPELPPSPQDSDKEKSLEEEKHQEEKEQEEVAVAEAEEEILATDQVSPTMPQLKLVHRRGSASPQKTQQLARDNKKGSDTPVVFSVFYGRPKNASPSSPTKPLNHVMFDAKVNGEFLENARKKADEPRGRLWDKRKQHMEADLAQFKEILYLAGTYNDRILELWGDKKCVLCGEKPAIAVVYQPLCCTHDGYYALADGDRLFALMLSMSKLVKTLDTHAKVRSAIGSNANVPYINGLAVPICSPEGECQDEANRGIAILLRELGKGLFDDDEFGVDQEDDAKNAESAKEKARHSSSGASGSKFSTDIAMFRDAVEADEWEDDDSESSSDDEFDDDKENEASAASVSMHLKERIPLRYSAICGQPILDGNAETRLKGGRLTCFVFTSRWEAGLLAGAGSGDDGCDAFQIIGSFHERFIMKPAEFRCCICPTPVLATTMVHRPISFGRADDSIPGSQALRQTMLKLLQYVGGKWKYPETKAALGYDGIHHINDFVVPICRRNTICEETARIAAKKFVENHLALGVKMAYPNLSPDTDLLGAWWVTNAGKIPKTVVTRVGLGLMTDTRDPNKAKAKAITANNKAIENIRRGVEAEWTKKGGHGKGDRAPTAGEKSQAETEEVRAGLEKEKGKTYTYAMEEEQEDEAAAAEGRPTWGGHPISEESAKLIEAGVHEMPLMKPMITMDMLKTLEEVNEYIDKRYYSKDSQAKKGGPSKG